MTIHRDTLESPHTHNSLESTGNWYWPPQGSSSGLASSTPRESGRQHVTHAACTALSACGHILDGTTISNHADIGTPCTPSSESAACSVGGSCPFPQVPFPSLNVTTCPTNLSYFNIIMLRASRFSVQMRLRYPGPRRHAFRVRRSSEESAPPWPPATQAAPPLRTPPPWCSCIGA